MKTKKNGGARPNAGRKKGYPALQAERLRELIAKKLSGRIDRIINTCMTKAEKGDLNALTVLLDRAYGRPPQSTDITSKGESINALINKDQAERIAKRILNGSSRG